MVCASCAMKTGCVWEFGLYSFYMVKIGCICDSRTPEVENGRWYRLRFDHLTLTKWVETEFGIGVREKFHAAALDVVCFCFTLNHLRSENPGASRSRESRESSSPNPGASNWDPFRRRRRRTAQKLSLQDGFEPAEASGAVWDRPRLGPWDGPDLRGGGAGKGSGRRGGCGVRCGCAGAVWLCG